MNSSSNDDEFKKGLMKQFELKFNLEIDNYLKETVESLDLNYKKNHKIIDELKEIYKTQPSQSLIINFGNGEITYEKWDGKTYNVINGSKDDINYETKIYFGLNDAYKDE